VARYEGELDRSCFLGARFEVDMTLRPVLRLGKPGGGFEESAEAFRARKETIEAEWRRVLDAAKLLGLLGGLGSRVRRGWGSLTLEKLHGPEVDWTKPESVEGYRKAIRDIIGRPGNATPPFSAFSDGSRIEIVATLLPDAMTAMDEIGLQMRRYRSWRDPNGEKIFRMTTTGSNF